MSDSTRHRLDGTECCGNEAWRGRWCDYHQGYEDGTQPDFDGIAWVIAGLLAKRRMVPVGPYVTAMPATWRFVTDPDGHPDVTEVWVRVDTLPPLVGEETEEGTDDGE